MTTLYLVRHADAGSRHSHEGPDRDRPLVTRGWRQARALRDLLADTGLTRLVSSPYVRCIQTLEPLGDAIGLPVEPDDRLAERAGAAAALSLLHELRAAPAVCCSHGDVIPDVLEALAGDGVDLADEIRLQKASTWVLTWERDRIQTGRYVPPPG